MSTLPQPSVDGQLVQPELDELTCGPQTPSLWTTVEGMLQGPAEADFIKDIVGPQLLREVEGARDELRSLLSILSDLRDSSSDPVPPTTSPSRQYTTAGSAPSGSNLRPHPPAPSVGLGKGVTLLQQRLKTLLETAKEPVVDAAFANPREKMVAQYVLNGNQRPGSGAGKRPGTRGSITSRGSSRPFSAASKDGSQTGSGGSSSYFDPTANLQPIKAKLRFDAVHEIKEQLQELFKNEKTLLLDDIELLRASIEEEMTWSLFQQPSAKEMTEMTHKLEEKEQIAEHQRTISSLPSAGAGGGSAASLLRHRSLPSIAQSTSVGNLTPTASGPAPIEALVATPPKAAPLAPLKVAAPKPTTQPRF